MVCDILVGDCREVLRSLPEGFFHCAVTSFPYWGLRSYLGVEPLAWDGDPACAHEWEEEVRISGEHRNEGFNEWRGNSPGQRKQEADKGSARVGTCLRCGI